MVHEYESPDGERPLSAEELRDADSDTQAAVIENWFRSRFEDPAEQTPYDTAEGGYQWIWGGPYEPREELTSEFDGIVPEPVILRVAKLLEDENFEWAPKTSAADYADQLADDIASASSAHPNFTRAVETVGALLGLDAPNRERSCLNRLLYANLIFALETYLADSFIGIVKTRRWAMQRFVRSTPLFQGKTFPMSDAFTAAAAAEEAAVSYLLSFMWHDLVRVKQMFHASFDVDVGDLRKLLAAVEIRHHIVHRNGKSRDGTEVEISAQDVKDLAEVATSFVLAIECGVAQIPQDDPGALF